MSKEEIQKKKQYIARLNSIRAEGICIIEDKEGNYYNWVYNEGLNELIREYK